jgi:hypothetical protein
MPQTGMDWWVIAGVVIAAVAAFIAYRQLRTKPAGTKTRISVRNSEGADVVGRDRGTRGADDAFEAEIDVSDSKSAKATGRDAGQD